MVKAMGHRTNARIVVFLFQREASDRICFYRVGGADAIIQLRNASARFCVGPSVAEDRPGHQRRRLSPQIRSR